jgi:2'-5' RNA ligase
MGKRLSGRDWVADEKTLCVMGMLDAQADRRFEAIKARIGRAGLAADAQPPHITFGIYSGIGREEMADWVGGILGRLRRTRLFFGQIGVFPESQVFFAAPSVTRALLDMHAAIHARYDGLCSDKNCLYSLEGGKWIPHITLATSEGGRAGDVLKVLLENFTPFYGEITRIRITEQEPLVDVRTFEIP